MNCLSGLVIMSTGCALGLKHKEVSFGYRFQSHNIKEE